MKHWYLQDMNGTNIGNISLNDSHADEIMKQIIGGAKLTLGGEWREGSNELSWFTLVPEPARPPVVIAADLDLLYDANKET